MELPDNMQTDSRSSAGKRPQRFLGVAAVAGGMLGILFSVVLTVIALHYHVCMIWASCVPTAAVASVAAVGVGLFLLLMFRRGDLAWMLIPLSPAVVAAVLVIHARTAPRDLFETCIYKPMPESVTIIQANWFFSCPPGVWIHFTASPETVASIIREHELEVVKPEFDGISQLEQWSRHWGWRPDWWTPGDLSGFTQFRRNHGGVQPWSENLWVNSATNECLGTTW